jgi:hypothetical protein
MLLAIIIKIAVVALVVLPEFVTDRNIVDIIEEARR